jgi:L-fucose isomerase-like protein
MKPEQFPWNQLDRPARVGLLVLGHRDYPHEMGLHFARAMAEALERQGIEMLCDPQALTDAPSAGAAARELLKREPDGVIVCPGTWLEGDTALAAIREIEHLPFILWGLPMFDWEGQRESTGSFVAACSLKGPLERMGYRFRMVVGLPDEAATVAQLTAFARAASAVQRLKRTRLGLMGYVAMAIYAGTFDHVLLRRIIGPEVVHLDTSSLIREIESIEEAAALPWLDTLKGAQTETSADRLLLAGKMAEALQRLALKHHLHGLNVKCQYELSQEYGMTPCLPLALLADRGLIASCEGDMQVHVAQTILRHVTGQVVPYADLLDLGARGSSPAQALFSACGFAPLSLKHESDPCRICEFDHPGFSGLICAITLKRGPVTFAQLSEGRGDYRLMYGTGTGVETELRQGRFPALQVELDCAADALLREIKGQHFALCYGDVTEELGMVCEMLGVEAVRV